MVWPSRQVAHGHCVGGSAGVLVGWWLHSKAVDLTFSILTLFTELFSPQNGAFFVFGFQSMWVLKCWFDVSVFMGQRCSWVASLSQVSCFQLNMFISRAFSYFQLYQVYRLTEVYSGFNTLSIWAATGSLTGVACGSGSRVGHPLTTGSTPQLLCSFHGSST